MDLQFGLSATFAFLQDVFDSPQMSSPKLDPRPVRREEIEFEHEDKVYVYAFNRFEDGKITFGRVPLSSAKKNPIHVLYPSGTPTHIGIALIVLYKGFQQGTADWSFLREILTILLGDMSKEACYCALKTAMTKTPWAKVDDVMQFVAPYSKWKVSALFRYHGNGSV